MPAEGTPTPADTAPEPTLIDATFTGKVLASDGFTQDLDTPLTIAATCLGPWCPSVEPGADYLAFIAKDDDGYRLEVSACPWALFQDPEPETLATMQSCFGDGPCEESPR